MGQYKCANGNCIDSAKVCDEVDDCQDASDENGCSESGDLLWHQFCIFEC